MHEATRTFCCRAGFVLACVLPTLLVGAWIGARRTPVYAAAQRQHWQMLAGRTLGLSADVERIEEPRPGAYILHGVRLRDPDSPPDAPPMARAPRVEIARGPTGLIVLGASAELSREQLPRLGRILHERLVRGPELMATPVHVSLSSLTLASAESTAAPLALEDVRLQLLAQPTLAKGALEFRLAGAAGEPARLAVERRRTEFPVATRWSLSSGAAPLPCHALATCWPALARLGEDCTFHGYVAVEAREPSWQAAVGGTFHQLDLQTLVDERFGPSLTGLARVDLNQAVWRDGQVLSAAGQLRARDGTISRRLWEPAARQLALEVLEPLASAPDTWARYDQLAFGFELDERALRLAGQCAAHEADTILADDYGPLVKGSRARPVEPIALVRALVPESNPQVPAVREAQQLMYWLPLPANLPARETALAPHPPRVGPPAAGGVSGRPR